jgi:adenosylcobinamide amidohydrolase
VIHKVQGKIEKDSLVVFIPPEIFPSPRAISWATYGGGISTPRYVVNHTIAPNTWVEDGHAYAESIVSGLFLPAGETIVMMTSVQQRFAGHAEFGHNELSVQTFATVGLGNSLAAGDPANGSCQPGTINLIISVAATLTDEALIECVAIATEAKLAFLFEHNVTSILSGKPATGTGTDCITVISLGIGERLSYAGKHTKLGELVGRTVASAMDDSFKKRFGHH